MSVQRVHLWTLAACTAVAIAAFALDTPQRDAPPSRLSALGAIPAGARFALMLDVEELRRSELGAILLAAGRELPGVGPLDQLCGFDPSASVTEIAIAIPGAVSRNEVGIAAAGSFRAEEIALCAEKVIRARGGQPMRTQVGSFVSVRDRARAGAEVAVRDGGPVLLGEGHYLRDMVDTADGRTENLRRDRVHSALREAVEGDAPLVASWSLDADWLERSTRDELARLSPLSEIRAAALAVRVTPEVSAHAVLVCPRPEACGEVLRVLTNLSRDLGPALEEELGADPLEGARMHDEGGEVHVQVSLTPERARTLAMGLLRRLTPAANSAPIEPDEVVRP